MQFLAAVYSYKVNVVGRRYDEVDLEGRVYIITGCNTGIGMKTVLMLPLHTYDILALMHIEYACFRFFKKTTEGYETAKALVRMGATVIMACRSVQKAEAAREKILKTVKSAAASRLIIIKLDLNGFDSVRKFVKVRFIVSLVASTDVDAFAIREK